MYCGKKLSEDQKEAIIAAKNLEYTNTRISAVINCSHSSIRPF
ncbi:7639_t:CDS:2 [Funneliformis mosseae]|uniref:7639_t:CDS:1 n=1 Tax=Funneliformis mosseae TaxID=27381 RepID=A0A9N9GI38_FUNMO|nr:7639_t:CDS:2 [Funneliformis mosseae]